MTFKKTNVVTTRKFLKHWRYSCIVELMAIGMFILALLTYIDKIKRK